MKKWKREWKVLTLALTGALGLSLAGCGAAKNSYTEAAASEMAMDTAAVSYDSGGGAYLSDGVSYEEIAYEEETGEIADYSEEGSGSPQVQDTARKLIRNVNLEVETEEFDELLPVVRGKTQELGGYIEESYTYNGSNYYGNRLRSASLTIRIPAQRLDEFLTDMAEVSNVISKNESVTDVTLQYVDMESHKKVLLVEQERLLALLEKAENIEDIISLESRLSEVRYQLESMESQLRVLDNQVSYSTVYLNIEEVAKLTPVKEQSVWEKISTGFMSSLYDVGKGFADFGIGVLIDLPYIVVWVVILVLLFLVLRLILRRIIRKRWTRDGYRASRLFSGKKKETLQNPEETTADSSAEDMHNINS